MKKSPLDGKQRADLVAKMRREEQQRQEGYREQALKLFPHVCGRCTRDFSGKSLRELTVHHKDHNHDNNPPNGSNWELLCLYCHEHEHTRGVQQQREADETAQNEQRLSHSPFAGLGEKFKNPR
jgi:5-methylcytosine-specific restriction endonuclease McrA